MNQQTAQSFMTKNPVTIERTKTISEAAKLMNEQNIGFVPVVDEAKPVGVVTDRDLVIRGLAKNLDGHTPIEQVMSPTCITVEPQHTVSETADKMAKHKIRRLLVVDQNQLVGIVALGDLAVREQSDAQAGKALSEISEQK
jgi:CBS domain-containing protein